MTSPSCLIALTPRGSSIHRMGEGEYRVCDQGHNCQLVSGLYKAEEIVRELERGFGYPYSTNFHALEPDSCS